MFIRLIQCVTLEYHSSKLNIERFPCCSSSLRYHIPQSLEIYKIKNSLINGDILDDLCHLIDYGDIDGELLPIINEPMKMITLILAPVGSAREKLCSPAD